MSKRIDVLVAGGTAVVAIGLLLGLPPLDAADPDSMGRSVLLPGVGSAAWLVLAAALVVQSAVLLAARRAPRTVLLVVAALPVLVAATVPAVLDLFGLTALPVVVAVVLAAVRVPLVRLRAALVGAAVLVALGTGWHWAVVGGAFRGGQVLRGLTDSTAQGILQAVGSVGIPLVVALVVQSRREVRRARDAEARAVGREADARVDAALARERAEMARELHDIAAHHLSGIALMAGVVDRQIDTDPASAHEGVRQVRDQSTAVLDDLRRLVGLLREDGAAGRSVETIAGIGDLVGRARQRGPVELRVLGADGVGADEVGAHEVAPLGDGVGPLAQLAAYRTVQEALANAAMHAPGAAATVTLDGRDARTVVIRVENAAGTDRREGASSSGGYGLVGMRERADLVGAGLQYGRTDGGGWQVTLTIGREAPPAAADATTDRQGEP